MEADIKLREQNDRLKQQREKVFDKDLRDLIEKMNLEVPVVLWSKSWCP